MSPLQQKNKTFFLYTNGFEDIETGLRGRQN